MQTFEPLECGRVYHIYNRGINKEDIFREDLHYFKFLNLYQKYVEEIAQTYAWCLMGNHFHFLVKIRDEEQVLCALTISKKKKLLINKYLSQSFGNLFNAYSQSFNYQTKRTGSLLQTPFNRKKVTNEAYLASLIFYIHNNPVKHGFSDTIQDYPWSSYHEIVSRYRTTETKDMIIDFFGDIRSFIAFHKREEPPEDITDIMLERVL